jgi:small subunit ribosomal protein S7
MEKILLFNRWDTSEVKINDAGLRNQINLEPIIVPRTDGRYTTRQKDKRKMNVVERLSNKIMVPGHRGKKHKLTSGHFSGNTISIYNSMKEAFEVIEKKTKKNPLQVLVEAIENSALLEEVASYRLGGIIARNAVVVSPQRRLDISLRHLSQGIYKASFSSRPTLGEVIAEELITAAGNDGKSFAVQERNRIEKEAEGAR